MKLFLIILFVIISLTSCYEYRGFYQQKAVLKSDNRIYPVGERKPIDIKPGDTINILTRNVGRGGPRIAQ